MKIDEYYNQEHKLTANGYKASLYKKSSINADSLQLSPTPVLAKIASIDEYTDAHIEVPLRARLSSQPHYGARQELTAR